MHTTLVVAVSANIFVLDLLQRESDGKAKMETFYVFRSEAGWGRVVAEAGKQELQV